MLSSATAVGSGYSTAAPVKGLRDYLRAVRRWSGLVLLITAVVSTAGACWLVRQTPQFRAVAEIQIEPPQYDAVLRSLVPNEVGAADVISIDKYGPNSIAKLKSHRLAHDVAHDPVIIAASPTEMDVADYLLENLTVKGVPGTNFYTVSLESTNPAWAAKLLNASIDKFEKSCQDDQVHATEEILNFAMEGRKKLFDELEKLDQRHEDLMREAKTLDATGRSVLRDELATATALVAQKRIELGNLRNQALFREAFPEPRENFAATLRNQKLQELFKLKDNYTQQAERLRRTVRNFDSDPSCVHVTQTLRNILDQIDELQAEEAEELPQMGGRLTEVMLAGVGEELSTMEAQRTALQQKVLDERTMEQQFRKLLMEREHKAQNLQNMDSKITDFRIVAENQKFKRPVKILQEASEPREPVRSARAWKYLAAILMGLMLGVGTACLIEHYDQSVQVPELLAHGLALPIYGFVPQIARAAKMVRGGHLWTSSSPHSKAADAYRNLHVSLLGPDQVHPPIVSLLVTSTQPGEGKSTTALNLAATCARAGERTLLLDADLRRPSLGQVFDVAPDHRGLVDVLRSELPWQRTVVRTELANLDFLPIGDPSDIPLEILGALELRQLIRSLSEHYDRVIVDGPAVLGMADCRMLGRIVDGALLVVRSGKQSMVPIQRAKTMLVQSGVNILGVVFNAMTEDVTAGAPSAATLPPPPTMSHPVLHTHPGLTVLSHDMMPQLLSAQTS